MALIKFRYKGEEDRKTQYGVVHPGQIIKVPEEVAESFARIPLKYECLNPTPKLKAIIAKWKGDRKEFQDFTEDSVVEDGNQTETDVEEVTAPPAPPKITAKQLVKDYKADDLKEIIRQAGLPLPRGANKDELAKYIVKHEIEIDPE